MMPLLLLLLGLNTEHKRETGQGMEKCYEAAEHDFIKDPSAVLATLRRIRNANDAVMFYNADRSIKFLLRNDVDAYDDDTETEIHADLCIVVEEEDCLMAKIIELEHDGYFEEPTTFVIESYVIQSEETAETADVMPLVHKLNAMHKYRICPCGCYLIKDQAPMCLYCEMTARPGSRDKEFCAICQDEGIAMHMTTQPCCGQRLHKACLATWREKGVGRNADKCPLCCQDGLAAL